MKKRLLRTSLYFMIAILCTGCSGDDKVEVPVFVETITDMNGMLSYYAEYETWGISVTTNRAEKNLYLLKDFTTTLAEGMSKNIRFSGEVYTTVGVDIIPGIKSVFNIYYANIKDGDSPFTGSIKDIKGALMYSYDTSLWTFSGYESNLSVLGHTWPTLCLKDFSTKLSKDVVKMVYISGDIYSGDPNSNIQPYIEKATVKEVESTFVEHVQSEGGTLSYYPACEMWGISLVWKNAYGPFYYFLPDFKTGLSKDAKIEVNFNGDSYTSDIIGLIIREDGLYYIDECVSYYYLKDYTIKNK